MTLWPRQPQDHHEHYLRARVSMQDIREQLDLGPDDPLPEFSTLPDDVLAELATYATPRGTYFDALPLSLLTTSAMSTVQDTVPDSAIEPRRFRKNIILETDPGAAPDSGAGALPEFDWVGHRLHIGEVVCEVVMPISRCVMVGLPQAELPHDRAILRSLATNTGMNLGVYLRVVRPGTITEGDPVHLHESVPTATAPEA
ncbi:MAG TPA: MOSC domain-containing protein [Candidatus Dietzia intestinipullorum]|nr:MOSC domain-containing protein [Candidatus Dietzia intestinipullorum]